MPSAPRQLDEMLDRWERAGIIDAAQGRRIRSVEAESAWAAAKPGGRSSSAPSGTELLAYLAVSIALAGVLTLVYASGASVALVAALTLAIGVIALAGARECLHLATAPSMRAAGACCALGAAAVGAAAGELSAALRLFTRTVVVGASCPDAIACPAFSSTDESGNVLLGASVVLIIALALLRLVPARLVAIVAIAAAYTGAVATTSAAQLHAESDPLTITVIFLAASAVLVGYGEALLGGHTEVSSILGFAGVTGATIPLYLFGGRAGVHLDVVGGVIAAAALAAGVALARAGIAYGAVVGVAGVVVDIGARNFSTATSLGVFFSITGIASVAALIATTRVLRGRGVRSA